MSQVQETHEIRLLHLQFAVYLILFFPSFCHRWSCARFLHLKCITFLQWDSLFIITISVQTMHFSKMFVLLLFFVWNVILSEFEMHKTKQNKTEVEVKYNNDILDYEILIWSQLYEPAFLLSHLIRDLTVCYSYVIMLSTAITVNLFSYKYVYFQLVWIFQPSVRKRNVIHLNSGVNDMNRNK